MRVIDPGHKYIVTCYDNYLDTIMEQLITFMKREGPQYPGNRGTYPGTNCQELLRVEIDRLKYLDNQIPCRDNKLILHYLRAALVGFERRAALRHGLVYRSSGNVEDNPTCGICGHIVCKGHE